MTDDQKCLLSFKWANSHSLLPASALIKWIHLFSSNKAILSSFLWQGRWVSSLGGSFSQSRLVLPFKKILWKVKVWLQHDQTVSFNYSIICCFWSALFSSEEVVLTYYALNDYCCCWCCLYWQSICEISFHLVQWIIAKPTSVLCYMPGWTMRLNFLCSKISMHGAWKLDPSMPVMFALDDEKWEWKEWLDPK